MTEAPTDGRTVGLIAVGGAIGTSARYAFSQAAPTAIGTFPTTTLVINVVGAFILGLLLGALGRHRPNDTTLRPLIGIGVLGGFTTFSTFSLETVQLARGDHLLVAAVYVGASVGIGLLAARVGERLVGATPASIREGEA